MFPTTRTLAAAAMVGVLLAPTAALAETPSSTTEENLHTALTIEAFDWARYTVYAEQADREDDGSASALFTDTAAEDRYDHLAALAIPAGLVGGNAQNLQAAIDGEVYEATVMYPEFAATARAEGCTQAASMFRSIAAEEKMHAKKYTVALSAITRGRGSIPRATGLQYITVTPQLPACGGQTQTNLVTAMHGEALATVKYQLFAEVALNSGNAALADLFAGTATVEFREHFSDEANLSGLMWDTETNLTDAAASEDVEATVTYPAFAQQATEAEDFDVASLFEELAVAEGLQRDAFLLLAER
ncbi:MULTISPECIES: ferritin family protein [unclassified Ornithinimicrobium]|uniref:ferritin family protein n=1 Tax=unclassified Ornithinimicrobium TaxID=2615080 RepID=UPI003854F296